MKIYIHKQRISRALRCYQRGIAVIWLILLLVPIMGFVILAVEGTRYIHGKSRIEDATEMAAFALILEDNVQSAPKMAQEYIRAYVRDIDDLKVVIERDVLPANPGLQASPRVRYTVTAQTMHQSWFHSDIIPSFPEKQTVKGSSQAIKSVSITKQE